MNTLQIELTRLIGKKELTFGCFINHKVDDDFDGDWHLARVTEVEDKHFFFYPRTPYGDTDWSDDESEYEIIGHPATLTDLHRWMNEKKVNWDQDKRAINTTIPFTDTDWTEITFYLPYDSNKDLLDQETSTLEKVISLITSNQ